MVCLSLFIFIMSIANSGFDTKTEKIEDNQMVNYYTENFVDFLIVDKEGNNLLNPDYKYQDRIDILIPNEKGSFKVFYDPKLLASKGYLIDDTDYSIRLYLSLPENDTNITETILRFDNKENYVFRTEYKMISNTTDSKKIRSGYQRKKIWVNDKLFWDVDSFTDTYPKIIINRDKL